MKTKQTLSFLVRSFFFAVVGLTLFSGSPVFAKKAKIDGVININTASQEQLTLLPRIGVKIAQRIIAYRKRYKFRNPRDLMKVKGIGPKTYLRMAKVLTTTKPTKFKLLPQK